MTREESREIILNTAFIGRSMEDIDTAIEMAAKALEQEPILDKITEIIEPLRHLSIDQMSDIEWQILRVIDKYKTESEE